MAGRTENIPMKLRAVRSNACDRPAAVASTARSWCGAAWSSPGNTNAALQGGAGRLGAIANSTVLPFGVVVLADAHTVVRQLRELRAVTARQETAAGGFTDGIVCAPLAK